MDIDKALRIFSTFLNSSWKSVAPLLIERSYTSDESSIGDWLQVNWEILVEKKVLKQNEYLEIYSDGADYYGSSSRMVDIEAKPTHTIKVFSNGEANDVLNSEIITNKAEFQFERFVGFENGYYVDQPPFNYALVSENSGLERVLAIEKIIFLLHQIEGPTFPLS
jgi:hypothetical protein